MAANNSLVNRLWNEPPVFFPVAVVFHLFLLVRGIADLWGTMAENAYTLLWYAVAAILSVFCLLLYRWAAIAYVLLTATGLLLHFILHTSPYWKAVGSTLYPFDCVYGLFLLLYIKRFR